jgi:hypothetical protein
MLLHGLVLAVAEVNPAALRDDDPCSSGSCALEYLQHDARGLVTSPLSPHHAPRCPPHWFPMVDPANANWTICLGRDITVILVSGVSQPAQVCSLVGTSHIKCCTIDMPPRSHLPSCPENCDGLNGHDYCVIFYDCPKGWSRWGDGSACRSPNQVKPPGVPSPVQNCDLGGFFGNPNLGMPKCCNIYAHEETNLPSCNCTDPQSQCYTFLHCPKGWSKSPDGTTCTGPEYGQTCNLDSTPNALEVPACCKLDLKSKTCVTPRRLQLPPVNCEDPVNQCWLFLHCPKGQLRILDVNNSGSICLDKSKHECDLSPCVGVSPGVNNASMQSCNCWGLKP